LRQAAGFSPACPAKSLRYLSAGVAISVTGGLNPAGEEPETREWQKLLTGFCSG
jgi:hypothetical protein